MHQKWVQMIPSTISGTFQPRIDFFYGLDVEIRPKLTPGAGTPRWALAAIHPGWGNRYFLVFFLVGQWAALAAIHRWSLNVRCGDFTYLFPHPGWIAAMAPHRENRQT